MKFLATFAASLAVATLGFAQCQAPQAAPARQAAPPSGTFNGDVSVRRAAQPGKQTELTAEARDFVKTGPVVFKNMDEAIRLSEKTGKTVVCWVSENRNPLAIFNDPTVRKVSSDLDATTIQVAMGVNPTADRRDRDGKRLGARVEFSSSNYASTAKTAYIPVAKLKDGDQDRILAFTRGQTDVK